jgi:hypothetical protein
MKRNVIMLLAGFLVTVMASPLFAAPDIKISGQVRARLRYWVDFDLDDKTTHGSGTSGSATFSGAGDRRYFDTRVRLGVDAKLTDSVRAVIQLEKYFDWGNTTPNGFTSGGTGGGACCLGTPNNSENAPYFRQAWMDFPIPGLQEEGWRAQLGRSFFNVGHSYIWGNSLTGEDGITLYGPLGPGKFKFRYAMNINQGPFRTGRQRLGDNELHQWGADYKFDVAEKQNVELYFLGNHDRSVDGYSNLLSDVATALPVTKSDDYYIGAAYSGVAGPVTLKAEGAYQFGDARKDVAFDASGVAAAAGPCGTGALAVGGCAGATTQKDISRSAFFIAASAAYKVIPAYTVTLDVSYATGDDDPADDTYNNFMANSAGFATSISRVFGESPFYFGNRSLRAVGNNASNRMFAYWGRGTNDVDSGGVFPGGATDDAGHVFSPGLIEVKLKNKYAASDKVTILGDLIVLWADQSSASTSTASGSSYMGTEIDLKVAYKPYKNILINNYFGYFISDSFFDRGAPSVAPATGFQNVDAWAYRAEAIVTF